MLIIYANDLGMKNVLLKGKAWYLIALLISFDTPKILTMCILELCLKAIQFSLWFYTTSFVQFLFMTVDTKIVFSLKVYLTDEFDKSLNLEKSFMGSY